MFKLCFYKLVSDYLEHDSPSTAGLHLLENCSIWKKEYLTESQRILTSSSPIDFLDLLSSEFGTKIAKIALNPKM